MHRRPAALALGWALMMIPLGAVGQPLPLAEAFARVIDQHPDLQVLTYSHAGLVAERTVAGLAPPLLLEAGVENVLGTGEAAGLQGGEASLSLASVIERADKRAARLAVANRRLAGVDLLREAKRLDLLAEVARRYLDVAAAQEQQGIALDEVAARTLTLAAARAHVSAGATPRSVALAADAALARARGDVKRAEYAQRSASRRLSLLWGENDLSLTASSQGLTLTPEVPAFETIRERLAGTPELRTFAHEARLREARLQLARTARTPDLGWEVGVRRLQASQDWGLVGTVSLPLGTRARATPGIEAAQAELSALEWEREGGERSLEATLAEAHGRLEAASAEAHFINDELLPRLMKAERAATDAFRRGAASYLEWAQLQGETRAAQRDRLNANLEAHRALIELQRLTGEGYVADSSTIQEAP